jgi:HAE1 family hydrophobic/amphiphilic exporter-1
LIAGTVPIAIGLNEAGNQRVSMGIAIIGGVISSTLLSLIVVPALLPFFFALSRGVNRFVAWVGGRSSSASAE